MDQGSMTGAQVLVRMLLEYNVEVIFGVPGDTSLALYEAIYDAGDRIAHVLARDERSATFMADAYARLSHRPGFCECPSGAGALYSVPGVAEANASSIPVVLFTSGISLAGEGKGTITEMPHHTLFEPITKHSSVVNSADKMPETVRRALRIATTGRPGAVHLVLPTETMANRVSLGAASLHAEAECRTYPAYRTRSSAKAVEELAAHLLAAERPVIVAGGGVNHSQANAAGPRPGRVPGRAGGHHHFRPGHHARRASAGARRGGRQRLSPACPPRRGRGRRAALCGLQDGIGLHHQVDLALAARGPQDPADRPRPDPAGEQLRKHAERGRRRPARARGPVAPGAADGQDVLALGRRPESGARPLLVGIARPQLHSDAAPLKAQRVIHELNRRLPSPSIVISDAGTPTPYITRFLRLTGDGSRVLIPRSFGGLGYAIPAVVGAWYARPDARPVALFGDGSLGMSTGELETIARLNVPAVMIHFNNGCFGWIKTLQSLHSKSKFMSVDFTPGDMSKVASVYGMPVVAGRDARAAGASPRRGLCPRRARASSTWSPSR